MSQVLRRIKDVIRLNQSFLLCRKRNDVVIHWLPYASFGWFSRILRIMNQTGKSQDTASDFLTVEQAADYLQLSTSSIRSYIRQGKLQAFRIAGLRKVLIPQAALLALLEPTAGSQVRTTPG